MSLSKRYFPLQSTMSPSTLNENGAFSSESKFSYHLSRARLTTHRAESLGTPMLSFTSDSLGLPILMAAYLLFRNSSRMVLISFATLIPSHSFLRQPPPIHPRQIQAAAMASPTFLCNRRCPCTRLPSCSQVHPSRPQRREPTRHRERSPQDHRLWLCPHSRP